MPLAQLEAVWDPEGEPELDTLLLWERSGLKVAHGEAVGVLIRLTLSVGQATLLGEGEDAGEREARGEKLTEALPLGEPEELAQAL